MEGPFVLSDSLPSLQYQPSWKIQMGEFMDMAELLKDKEGGPTQYTGQAGRREVPDMISRLHCCSMYAAIVCENHPEKTREMWAYQATMIAKARRCVGRGWLL